MNETNVHNPSASKTKETEMAEGNSKLSHYYRSLSRNMVIIMVFVSITPMVLVGGIIFYQYQESHKEKVYDHLQELVGKHKQNIDAFLREKLSDIRLLADTSTCDDLSEETFLQNRLQTLQKSYGAVFVDLGLVNAKGMQISYAGPFKLGKAQYANADWFYEVMTRDYYISDVFLGLRGLPHFIIAVRENWNGESWILRATIDFVAFNTLVENIRIGETGFAFILNRRGDFQTKPRETVLPADIPLTDFVDHALENQDNIHVVLKEDNSGQENIYVAAFLKGGQWLLVYQQLAEDAFSDLNRALRITIIIFVISSICIVVVAFILSRRMVNRIAQADREKELMNEQIIETGRLASVGELAAGIAHEINNPVAIMVEEAGWINDLLEDEEFQGGKNQSEFRRALDQIQNQGRRCKEITQKLLSFARKTDARVQVVQINDLIREIVSLSEQRAKYSNVTFRTNLLTQLPTMELSKSELQQVLLNLINNALDAMDKRGGTIEINTRLKGDYVEIDVSDNGPGIPEANLGRIFDPFFTTKPVGKGTGLGLSICYGIIKKMGGSIEVQSAVDVETTFTVKMPLVKKNDEG